MHRTAQSLGYGLLQPGVLIAMTDARDRIGDVLARCPADARLCAGSLTMTADDAARAAGEALGLVGLDRAFRSHCRTLREALAPEPAPTASAETLRRFAELSMMPLVDTLREPGLPPELLPEDWPLPELLALIDALDQRYGPPARRYVQRVLAA